LVVDVAPGFRDTSVYDANDRLIQRWTPARTNTFYSYDQVGNLTNIDYDVSTDIRLAYDALNRLTNMVDAIGTTKYGYTTFGALLSEDGPWDNDTVSYTYDNGRRRNTLSLLQPNASAWAHSYTHDSMGRLRALTSPAGTFNYSYSGPGSLLTNVSLPNGARITNSYDTSARMTATVLLNSTNCILNSHSDNFNVGGQRTQSVRKAGDYIDYSYDNIGQLSSALAKEGGGADRALEQLRYVYDSAGNLSYSTNNQFVQTFNVNELNQLTNVTRAGTLTVVGTTTSAATNVTVNTSNSLLYADNTFASTNHSLTDGTNTFIAVAKDNLGRIDTNTSVAYLPSSPTFIYDANGNLTYDGLKSYEWDDENQLIGLTAANAWKSQFAYDGKMRRRIRREYTWQNGAWVQTNEVRYIYDGNLVLQERNNWNLAAVTYTRGVDLSSSSQRAGGIGGLLARTDNAELSIKPCAAHAYYHSDGNGNLTTLLASNQLVVARYLYDPFGTILAMSGSLAEDNLYRFSTKEFHEASGLLYYLHRYYDSRLSRWVNRDPIQEDGGLNLYIYVGNAPITRVDPLGLNAYLFREVYGGPGHATLIVDNPKGGVEAFGFHSAPWHNDESSGAVRAFFVSSGHVSHEHYDNVQEYIDDQLGPKKKHALELKKIALGTSFDDEFIIDWIQDVAKDPPLFSIAAARTCFQVASDWFWEYLSKNRTLYPTEWSGRYLPFSVPSAVYQTPNFRAANQIVVP